MQNKMPIHSFEGRRDNSRRVPLLSFDQADLDFNPEINNEQEDPYRQWVAASRRFESGHSTPRWIGHQQTGSSSRTRFGIPDDFGSSVPTLPAAESTDALPATPSTAKEPRRSHFVEDLTEALSRHHSEDTRMVDSVEPPVLPQGLPQGLPQRLPQGIPQGIPTNSSGYRGKSKYPLPSANEEEEDSKFLTELYTISHLIFFSILGTLARLGLSALTFYPGTPVQTGVLWANFAGSLIMGFLAEDRQLFRAKGAKRVPRKKRDRYQGNIESLDVTSRNHSAAKANEELAIKKKIPLHIGLATGFCGSCTSFSAFIRDAYLAISNNIPHPAGASTARNGAYSLLAVLAVIMLTIILSLGGLLFGAHISLGLQTLLPSLHTLFARKGFNRLMVFIAFGSWLGAVILTIFPPYEYWRTQVLFSLIFAPLGCLLRFYISLHLNPRIPAFPLGTFLVNMLGTGLFALFYDLQHIPSLVNTHGGIGCEMLQGGMDGFCGALTTISTWVAELKAARRISRAYVYGGVSLAVGLALAVVIIGTAQWTVGFQSPKCTR